MEAFFVKGFNRLTLWIKFVKRAGSILCIVSGFGGLRGSRSGADPKSRPQSVVRGANRLVDIQISVPSYYMMVEGIFGKHDCESLENTVWQEAMNRQQMTSGDRGRDRQAAQSNGAGAVLPRRGEVVLIGSQYFLYFGVLGIFLPYFNLYCYHLGFSGFQIGAISSVRSTAMVIFPMVWGILADRFRMRRPIYILCNAVATAVWALFMVTTDFTAMLVISFIYGIFYAPIISFLEAFTMDALGGEKKRYGALRAWGSISFITSVLVVGKVTEMYSTTIILVPIFIGSLLLAVLSSRVPCRGKPAADIRQGRFAGILTPRVLIFLLCAFLMLLSHGTYYGFFSIHLENLGYGNMFIGGAWALASIAEILVMVASNRLFQAFSLEGVLIFSFTVAVCRWGIMSMISSPVAILLSQVLHAVTYGTFHMASILYIDRLSPPGGKTLGQAVNNAVTYGLGLMVGFFLNGLLFERMGVTALFQMSAGIALGGGLMFRGLMALNGRLEDRGGRHLT